MQKIVLASGNSGKIIEIRALLERYPISLIPQHELGVVDVAETGTTFVENAIIKARHAATITDLPAIADDSGLAVDALNGAPGVYSARYAGDNADDADRIEKVLHEMRVVPLNSRSACFHCVIVWMRSAIDPAPIIAHGRWHGEIMTASRGHQGFGYDPIFWIPEYRCSAAELNASVKNRISHRGKAFEQLNKLLKGGNLITDAS